MFLLETKGECVDPGVGLFLSDYLLDELEDRDDIEMVEHHLERCPRCSTEKHNWDQMVKALSLYRELIPDDPAL